MTQPATASLYFGLHDGRIADLEIISAAAIEWVNTIRLATEMIEPGAKVSVKLVDASEGSLSLNTVFDWGERVLDAIEKSKHPRLLKLAISLAAFLVVSAGPTIDYWFGQPDQVELSEEDRALLEQLLEKISQSDTLRASNRKFFKALSRDPAIASVGVCETPGGPAMVTVPSGQFAERSGLWEGLDEPETRKSERISDVLLETPNLSNKDRVWRFKDIVTDTLFTAKMRDDAFLKSLQTGDVNEKLRIGIRLRIRIQFDERLEDGEWKSLPATIEVVEVMLGD